MSKQKPHTYRCPHCKYVGKRDSSKQWIKSWCETTGKDVRLQIVKKQQK